MATIYRAEVIGSMLRPGYLKQAREARQGGTLDALEFKRIEDRAVDEALAIQERAGVDIVTDGEMRRSTFIGPLTEVIEGYAPVPGLVLHWRKKEGDLREEQEARPLFSVVGRLRRRQAMATEEFVYLRARTRKPIKITLPSPLLLVCSWSREHSGEAYPDPMSLFADATEIVRREVQELAALGCQYIQIDAPELTWLADDLRLRELAAMHPRLPERMLSEGLELINSIADAPGVTFGLHMCRGNYQGYWMSEGPWERISQQVFTRACNYDIFLLEYDDWRAGSFESLRDIPAGKRLVLGLISTKREALEPADQIIARIEEAGRCFPREQLALSTQCGFSPEAPGSVVSAAAQEAKLRLVAEIAHRVWNR